MAGRSYVVAFPSAPSRGRVPLLMGNIRRALAARGQAYTSVGRDGPAVVVDAADPVFASTAVAELPGVERVSIARRAGRDFGPLVAGIAEVGAGLLLRGDAFCVRVGGRPAGYEPADAEMAATSAIISRASGLGARPGPDDGRSRVFRAFVARSWAYVDIFSDAGPGGAPAGSHAGAMACPVFDGPSAASCAEAVRQGFDVRIVALYRRRSALPALARMAARIAPMTARGEAELEFLEVLPRAGRPGYAQLLGAAVAAAGLVAERDGMGRVGVPASPLSVPAAAIDAMLAWLAARGIAAYMPLAPGGGPPGPAVPGVPAAGRAGGGPDAAAWEAAAREAAGTSMRARARAGPNAVHEVLDGLGGARARGARRG